ncbi:cell growth regulator with RING finger domain protein 1 isoform X2 [Leptinotarsa decemlineata]|uniref:cell growth regulator with RING finger domain protein 1 isoform X2 n=1 Tax=Leptinotarsa decemlineata TaxID=7539 RepID=UPI000C255211|nr:cell growth regulator with RING finger domain protein 1-like [Leptinotarsa decemlineata]
MVLKTMTTLLMSAAEFSNIFSVLALLLCFCGMILFITRNMMVLRVNGEDFVFPTTLHQVPPRIPQMNMMKVHIPFTFKLLETSTSSYSELQCCMSSQVKYGVHVYWGVKIRELHIFLWRPWSDLRNACLNGEFLRGYYQYPGPQLERRAHLDQNITLKLDHPLDLGTPPRLCYPLVVVLFRTDGSENIHPDETVALINVIHIKDSVCTLPTSILSQYLKQANGQLSCLKQLYLATGNPGSYEEGEIPLAVAEPVEGGPGPMGHTLVCPTNEDSTIWNSSGEQLCVVCQSFPLSRALLPCRHTCICASCFAKLDRCPMCRGPIKSYFCIRGEEYMPISSNTKTPSSHSSWYNWLHHWDDRLIDFLGFQR